MKYYSFSIVNGEYTGFGEAVESPREPGVYLFPANATFEVPPELKEHEANVWNGTVWNIVPDFRGQVVYYVATGMPVIVSELGALPETVTLCECPERLRGYYCYDGAVWIPDEARRAELLTLAKAKIDAATDASLAAGVEFAGNRFPLAGPLYAQNMNAFGAYMARQQTQGRYLYTVDGGYALVTDIAGLIALGDDTATNICMSGAVQIAALNDKSTGDLIAFVLDPSDLSD